LKRNTIDPGPDAPIYPANPASPPNSEDPLEVKNIYRKTPPFCSCHHPKISALVKRRSRGQDQRGYFNLKHLLLSTPHDFKAARPTPQSLSLCEKDDDSQEAIWKGSGGVQ